MSCLCPRPSKRLVRGIITRHFQSRTKGESATQFVPYNAWGRRDKWWDAYAGTQYAGQDFEWV